MILSIGEILFDIFPDDKRLGGAPFNYSYHIKQLGEPVAFISRIGNDDEGKSILNFLEEHRFPTDCIQIDDTHETGKVRVALDDTGGPEFDILKNAAYDHIAFDPAITTLLKQNVDLIYFGSLIQRTKKGADTLNRLMAAKSSKTKGFCDINLRPDCYDRASVLSSLAHADLLKVNTAEIKTIKKMTGDHCSDADFIRMLMKKYQIELVAWTQGSLGSVLYMQDHDYEIRIPKIEMILDTVGAGDAYAAMLTMGYLNRWHPARILSAASSFASRICLIDGAVPSSKDFYDDFLTMLKEKDRHGK